ncbi:MAG: alcohol dehydrogenase, propanol-preferring [Hyphomicrobiales bacterium]|jgi:D-arabinose 1-dehydrogenase-like Zn-dependent alcohol dehydrogenase|nr:alcohol dehydrogenase, propanol-preferring [Hyphomicrobiales bacterium]
MKMRSFQVCQCGAPLQMNEAETPKPQGTQVLLKMLAAGVCHSDLHIWDGYYEIGGGKKMMLADRGIKLPLTMGHENVGEVVAVGPDAKGVNVGDVRLVNPWMGCGECKVCQRGDENLCLKPQNVGVFSQGGYATHMLVPSHRHLFDIGNLSPTDAAPLACSGVTAFSALKKIPTLQDEAVVIIGAGGVGLMGVTLAKKMGAKDVIIVDIDAGKRDAALKAGATQAVDGGAADAAAQIQKATGGGAWGVIDFVGSGATVNLAVASIIKGGTIVVVGLYGGDITVPTPYLPLRAMTLRGSYVGSQSDMAELIDLVKRTGMPPVPIRTRPLDAVNDTLNDLRAGKIVGRVVLTPAA